VAKFRKNSDYNDDYEYSQKKKRSNKHDPFKKLTNYDYDRMIQEDESVYTKSSRRKARQSY
jgi:hypothetical protein